MTYVPTIGLEIHAELNTKSKMFCDCPNDPFAETPNIYVCPVCMGHPGTLPVINKAAVESMAAVGMALDSEIARQTKFDRKNYFYPDLPKGYQISQYDVPLCEGGSLQVGERDIRITRVHLEEDTGKLVHGTYNDDHDHDNKNKRYRHSSSSSFSLVNYNRAGVPLMELVTEPDITSGEEAREFAEELQLILRYLDVSDADMEKGNMRLEANVSVREEGSGEYGTKVEVKNLNSFAVLEKAIAYEIERQKELLEKGEEVTQQTRGWDENKAATRPQREKEAAHDYRYFPEPDLPPLELDEAFLEDIRKTVPELPAEKRERFAEQYAIGEEAISVFVRNPAFGDYFEHAASELVNWIKASEQKSEVGEEERAELFTQAANYLVSELRGILQKAGIGIDSPDFRITPENFAEFIKLLREGRLSSKTAKTVLQRMVEQGGDPSQIIEEEGLEVVSDTDELSGVVEEVIAENEQAVEDYKSGNENAVQFLMGQVMKKTQGQAEPQTVTQLLKERLAEGSGN